MSLGVVNVSQMILSDYFQNIRAKTMTFNSSLKLSKEYIYVCLNCGGTERKPKISYREDCATCGDRLNPMDDTIKEAILSYTRQRNAGKRVTEVIL